jgi:Na+/H+-dicarboxylate symporter
VSTKDTTRTHHLPGWLTNFGFQIIAGLVIGIVLGLIARATDPPRRIRTASATPCS